MVRRQNKPDDREQGIHSHSATIIKPETIEAGNRSESWVWESTFSAIQPTTTGGLCDIDFPHPGAGHFGIGILSGSCADVKDEPDLGNVFPAKRNSVTSSCVSRCIATALGDPLFLRLV
jgi:hypothetical protein